MKIDSHHHFWKYDTEDYGWINESMAVIRRDFLPSDLKAEIEQAGIDGVVSVQARQSLEETDWLLQLAEDNGFIKGVVGWVPLIYNNISELLEGYAMAEKLKAVRHIVQGQPAGFLDGEDFNRGIRSLTTHNLIYDILIFENQLGEAIHFVDRHPNQVFVLDHIAKPKIKENILSPWDENIRKLAKRENVSCKLSGLVTEADHSNWNTDQLKPYMEIVLEAFGSKRLMFGSDWPVCLLASSYKRWVDTVIEFIGSLSESEQSAIMGGTATRIYRL